MVMLQNLAKQLVDPRYEYEGNLLADKQTLNRMSEDFQDYLYPLLFEPQTQQDAGNESTQTD
jgi:hypothetical protein